MEVARSIESFLRAFKLDISVVEYHDVGCLGTAELYVVGDKNHCSPKD